MSDAATARRLERYAEAVAAAENGAHPQLQRAVALLREGLNGVEIAQRMQLPTSTVYQWLSDPYGTHNQARKARYHGICKNCGGETNGTASGRLKKPDYCAKCCRNAGVLAVWSKESIIEAIREYAKAYGRPPTVYDFSPNLAQEGKKNIAPERRAEIERRLEASEGGWPSVTLVQRYFGTWNAAIRAAGFTTLGIGYRRDPERWYRNRFEDGQSSAVAPR